jgi:hypothetical protein
VCVNHYLSAYSRVLANWSNGSTLLHARPTKAYDRSRDQHSSSAISNPLAAAFTSIAVRFAVKPFRAESFPSRFPGTSGDSEYEFGGGAGI